MEIVSGGDISDYDWSKGKHLVLDIDETLFHTIGDNGFVKLRSTQIMSDPKLMPLRERIIQIRLEDIVNKKGEGLDHDMWAIKRPHLEDFLAFSFNYFDSVGIWSAGMRGYVHEFVGEIFGPLNGLPQPAYIWSREKCTEVNGIASKPLSKLFDEEKVAKVNKMSLSNTLILDDRHDNIIANDRNGIINPEYRPEANVLDIARDEISLLQFKAWLERPEVKNATDIRNVKKSGIFNTSLSELSA